MPALVTIESSGNNWERVISEESDPENEKFIFQVGSDIAELQVIERDLDVRVLIAYFLSIGEWLLVAGEENTQPEVIIENCPDATLIPVIRFTEKTATIFLQVLAGGDKTEEVKITISRA
jgi:hypothetical protein